MVHGHMHWLDLELQWEAAHGAAEEACSGVSWSTQQRVASLVVHVSCHMS